MRLWSINPNYLDSKGLVALWREALLAQKVLAGKTVGYKNHPQLERFKRTSNPLGAIATYLRGVADEANNRGYKFDKRKILNRRTNKNITVKSGQVAYEFEHLVKKLHSRDHDAYKRIISTKRIKLHPLFVRVNGGIENWEIL